LTDSQALTPGRGEGDGFQEALVIPQLQVATRHGH
jgi:hypothetical protein